MLDLIAWCGHLGFTGKKVMKRLTVSFATHSIYALNQLTLSKRTKNLHLSQPGMPIGKMLFDPFSNTTKVHVTENQLWSGNTTWKGRMSVSSFRNNLFLNRKLPDIGSKIYFYFYWVSCLARIGIAWTLWGEGKPSSAAEQYISWLEGGKNLTLSMIYKMRWWGLCATWFNGQS